ncbi:hypothetical protein Q7P37_011371 [Cladosporium fusiforme]
MSDFPQSATSGLPGQHPTSTTGADYVDADVARHTSATGNSGRVGTEGIVPTVLSYVGLSPSQSRDNQPHATDDRGFVAGIGAGAAAATGAAGMAVQQGHGPAAAAAGSLAAAGVAGAAVYGGSRAGANDATAEPAFGASVSPTASRGAYTTDSEKAKEVAARATGGAVGYGQDAGSRADYGLDADSGVRDGRVRDTTGVGAVGVGSSTFTGSSTGSHQAGNDRFTSTTGDSIGGDRFGSSSGLPAGNDRFNSTTGDAVGGDRFGSSSGLSTGNDRFNSTSGDAVGSDRYGSSGGLPAGNDRFNSTSGDAVGSDRYGSSGGLSAGNNPEGARDPTQAGLEGTTDRTGDRKTSRAVEGASTGANPSESQTSAEQSQNQPKSGGSKGKLENKDAIPIAGGIKLGEKHWGESDIIPDNPRPSGGDNVSSAEGQPDQSTRDNTAANTGHTGGSHGAGSPEKEGILDKVKDKLNIGHKD